jgi:Phage integrase, N-terminal SAM-like domain
VRPPRVRPSTWSSYRMAVERHIVPALGGVLLQGLTPAHLSAFYRALLDGGRRDRRGGLAPKSVRNVHGVLHTALVVNYEVVVSEPKTAKGRRSLALDPATVAALCEHRTRQLEQRLAVGPRWQDCGLVFT